MPPPAAVVELVQRFDENLAAYYSYSGQAVNSE